MTSSTSSQPQHTVVENIDHYLEDGRPVFDKNGDKIGEVKMYSTVAGYLLVGSRAPGRKDLYIPFRLIRNIDPRDIFLAETKDTLESKYTEPPTISTITETRLVPGPQGDLTPQTRQVQLVQSGYDAKLVTTNPVDMEQTAKQLAVGMAVYDALDKRVGDLTQYDVQRGLLVVERGIFKPRVLIVPFGAIKQVDRKTLSVYLALPEDTIVREHAMLP